MLTTEHSVKTDAQVYYVNVESLGWLQIISIDRDEM